MPRGRPRKNDYNYIPPKRQICDVCGQNLLLDKFYKSNNNSYMGADDTFPICKECIAKQVKKPGEDYDLKALDGILCKINRPFDGRLWEKSLAEAKQRKFSPIGVYFRNAGKTSGEYNAKDLDLYLNNKAEKERVENLEIKETSTDDDFDIAQAQELFGSGLTMREYQLMDKKYKTLIQSYSVKTAMHKEFLLTYVRYKVKEEMAIID